MPKWDKKYEKGRKYRVQWEKTFPWLSSSEEGNNKAFCNLCRRSMLAKRHSIVEHEKSTAHAKSVARHQSGMGIEVADIMASLDIAVSEKTERRREAIKLADGIKIGFIGGGSMARGMIEGLLRSNVVDPNQLMASAPTDRNLPKLRNLGVTTSHDNAEVVQKCDIVVIACKPYQCADVLPALPFQPHHLVLTVVAGLSSVEHEQYLPPGTRLVRTLPNVAIGVCEGNTSVVRGTHATDEDMETVAGLLSGTGQFEVMSDKHLEIVASTSGCGIAWAAMVMEGLADGAVNMGLPRAVAMQAAAITLVGAGKLYLETGRHPGEIKDSVTSPGGTTIRGVHALEKRGLRAAMMDAVEAAVSHSKNMAGKK